MSTASSNGRLARLGLVAVAFVGAVILVPALSKADPPAGAAPVATIKDLMNAFNQKSTGMYGLVKAALAGEPTAADWKVAGFRAIAIAECGNLLLGLTPPRGAEDDAGKAKWAGHASGYRDCAKQLAKLIKDKKLAEARTQLGGLEKRCDACHADHQLE